MIKWAPLVFVRFTFFLICGILVHIYSGVDFSFSPWLFGCSAGIYVFLFLLFRTSPSDARQSLLGITALVCTFLFGIALTQIRTEKFEPGHLLHLNKEITFYQGTISTYVTQKPGTFKAEITVSSVLAGGEWQPAEGKIMVAIAKDSTSATLRYGDVLVVKGKPQVVKGPTNPKEFDYRSFLSNKGIYHQQFVQPGTYVVIERNTGNQFLLLAFGIRNYLDDLLRRYIPGRQEYGLAKALVLGITDELDNSVLQAYSAAGVMHVLAVSGLHVGIIYAVLELLLKRVSKGKRRKVIGAVISLIVIWLYAFITGFSPSVLRAVVMFSFFSIGKLLQRQNASYNVLALSAFCLLCYDPYMVTGAGFQLSYLAVLGIIYLHPRLYRLFEFRHSLIQWAWTTTSISLAAQIATAPLVIYLFHQFPLYFLFTNLIIIPVSTLVLYGGLLVLVCSMVPPLAHWVGILVELLIWVMNQIIFFFEMLPSGVTTGLDISLTETCLLYLVIGLLAAFFEVRKLNYFVIAVGFAVALCLVQLQEVYLHHTTTRFAVYNTRRQSALDFITRHTGIFVEDSSLLNKPNNLNYFIMPNWWSLGVEKPALHTLEFASARHQNIVDLPDGNKLLVMKGKSALLLWRPLRMKFKEAVIFDFVVLQKNSRNTLPDMQSKINFKRLILDASNSPKYIMARQSEARALGVNSFAVSENGAFIEYF